MYVTKIEAINILEEMKSEENLNRVMKYINRVNQMSDEEWQKFAINNNLTVETFCEEAKRRIMRPSQEFTKINDLVSYGTTDDTLHIHLVPKDAHSLLNRQGFIHAEQQLIDALEHIRIIMEHDEKLSNINQVFAVSGILHGPVKRMFDNLGFSTKNMKIADAKKDPDLAYFYEMFKESKQLGRAVISRNKLESEEWKQLAKARKEELQNKAKKYSRDDEDKDY